MVGPRERRKLARRVSGPNRASDGRDRVSAAAGHRQEMCADTDEGRLGL